MEPSPPTRTITTPFGQIIATFETKYHGHRGKTHGFLATPYRRPIDVNGESWLLQSPEFLVERDGTYVVSSVGMRKAEDPDTWANHGEYSVVAGVITDATRDAVLSTLGGDDLKKETAEYKRQKRIARQREMIAQNEAIVQDALNAIAKAREQLEKLNAEER